MYVLLEISMKIYFSVLIEGGEGHIKRGTTIQQKFISLYFKCVFSIYLFCFFLGGGSVCRGNNKDKTCLLYRLLLGKTHIKKMFF